jgi:hypothetical protein
MRDAGKKLRRIFGSLMLAIVGAGALGATGSQADEPPPISASGPSAPVYEYATAAQQASAARTAGVVQSLTTSKLIEEGRIPTYNIGYVQKRTHVYIIFWGSEWNSMSGTKEKLVGLYQAINGGPYGKMLTQYFDRTGYISGELSGLTTYTDGSTAPGSVQNQEQVKAEVEKVKSSQGWPTSYENDYVVYTPPHTPMEKESFCAYHQWGGGALEMTWTYVPWPISECARGLEPWASLQVSSSHEFSETVTDPIPKENYWGWAASIAGGEVSDLCNTREASEREQIAPGIWAAKDFDDYEFARTGNGCLAGDNSPQRFEVHIGNPSVGLHEATLAGTMSGAGWPIWYDFELEGPGGTATIPAKNLRGNENYGFAYAGTALGATPVSAPVSGLKGNTTYHVRLQGIGRLTQPEVSERRGTPNIFPGGETQFTTPAWTPLISGVGAVPGKLNMTLHATIDGQGTPTHYHFEYGPTTSYGSNVPISDEGTGSGVAEVTKATPGEIEGTYHYRVVATNEEGTTYSPDQEVYVQERPTIASSEVVSHIGESAAFGATLNPHGKETTWFVEYGPTPAYGSKSTVQNAGSGNSIVNVSTALSGLNFDQNYHARIVAENWAGVRQGTDIRFTAGVGAYRIEPVKAGVTGPIYHSVSCASGTSCVAIGAEGLTVAGGAAEWNGAQWITEVIPGQAETTQTDWYELSCAPGASSCEAIGYEVSGKNNLFQPIVERRVGPGNWERQAYEVPIVEGQRRFFWMWGIDCTSATNCVAAGALGVGSGLVGVSYPAVERWDGSKWQAERLPTPVGAEAANLKSVSCASASSCTATGETVNAQGVITGLYAERWNGSIWSPEAIPSPPGKFPEQVDNPISMSCASNTCEVVASYIDSSKAKRLFAERYTGTKWEVQSLPSPEGSQPFFELSPPKVSCPSSAMCELVGTSDESEPGHETSTARPHRAYAERFNGTSWEEQVLPRSLAGFDHQGWMYGVDCATTTACAAAGASQIEGAQGQEGKGLAEVFLKSPSPTALTEAAKEVTESSSRLVGTANPNWIGSGKAYFEYGTTTSYGTTTPEQNLGAGGSTEEVTQAITGLQEATAYHYRLVVVAGGKTVDGEDRSFETVAPLVRNGLEALPVTDPFNGTSSAISNFEARWTALPWATTSFPKGEDRSSGWGGVGAFPNIAGASYGPTITDLGTGIAAETTMGRGPGQEGRYFAIWLDMPGTPTTKSGYQLKFAGTGTNQYTVTLNRWSNGTPTVLAEKTNYAFAVGSSLALVDEGSIVSAWTNTGSGFTRLVSAADSTYSAGTVAVEAEAAEALLKNLKFGVLQSKAANMSAALGQVRLDDAFATAESPLSESGTWAPLSWDYQSAHDTGTVVSGGRGWGAIDAFAKGIDGAYWTKASFADTGSGDAVGATITVPQGNTGRYFDLLLDMANPATARNGYELSLTETSKSNIENIALEKRVAGVSTALATKTELSVPVGTRFALADKGGTLTVWMAAPTGEFTQLLSAADSTYTNGYVGVAAGGNLGTLTNFRGGQLAPF